MVKGICSDFDGTLIDSKKLLVESWYEAFEKAGVHVNKEELSRYVGLETASQIVARFVGSSEVGKSIIIWKGELFLNYVNEKILFPDTIPFLQETLRRGIKVAIGSNMSSDLLNKVVDKLGIRKYISAVVGADDVKHGKPDPELFIKAFSLLGINPKEGMVIGDTINDVLAGKASGAFTVFISREGKKNSLADLNIYNLLEVLNYI